jgi:hypothetical protein
MKAAGEQPLTLAKFAGKVQVDGSPPKPEEGHALVVMLYPSQPNKTILVARCGADGAFEFTTEKKGDGVPKGSYVVLFGEFKIGARAAYKQPDDLKNLYDDPDKNGQDSQFKVDLQPPGKTGCQFDLKLAGQEAASPGPNAILRLPQERRSAAKWQRSDDIEMANALPLLRKEAQK